MSHDFPNSEYSDSDPEESSSQGALFSSWGWPLFGLAAFVVFEVTADPRWTAVVFSLRFGCRDAITALQMLSRERYCSRGWGIFLALLGNATGKTYFVAMLIIAVLARVEMLFGQRANPGQLIHTVRGVLISGLAVAGLCGLSSIFLCWRHGIRLWIDENRFDQVGQPVWPPRQFSVNRVAAAFIGMLFPVAMLLLIVATGVPFQDVLVRFQPPQWVRILLGLLIVSSVTGVLILLLKLPDWLSQRIFARTPFECWPELSRLSEEEIEQIRQDTRHE